MSGSLVVEGLSAGYSGRTVIEALSLPAAAPGEVLSLIGPNAAGKSTLLRALAGLLPAHGSIMLDGVEVPYTFENAKKIWADPRFGWMRPLAQAFISDDGGFFPA